MGKASRRKRERREGKDLPVTPRSVRRAARRADIRGQRIGTSLESYERLCQNGPDRLAETLIARHTKRMEQIVQLEDYFRMQAMSCMTPVGMIDLALREMGASQNRHPASPVGDTVDHLTWAIDSSVAAIRLLLCGQVVGAAVLARNQMERWLLHRAHGAGISQAAGESTLDFIARAWSTDDSFSELWISGPSTSDDLEAGSLSTEEPELDHKHVFYSDESEACPAVLYAILSEVMHGRELPVAICWDSRELLTDASSWPDEVSIILGAVTDSVTLCLRQVRLAAAALAAERGRPTLAHMLLTAPDRFTEPTEDGKVEVDRRRRKGGRDPFTHLEIGRVMAPGLAGLAPLAPGEGLSERAVASLESTDRVFQAVLDGTRPAGRLFRDDEFAFFAFGSRRYRSARAANRALEREMEILGSSFNQDGLQAKMTAMVILTEALPVISRWESQAEIAVACAFLGTSLRSAQWLWLEDDDRAMGVLRCTLEQAARLRTWRLKRPKAEKLEQSPATTPRDWIEAAGWKRLAALNRALGEFAHVKATSRWHGARELLAQMQLDVPDDEVLYTARGAALRLVSTIAATECLALAVKHSAILAETLEQLFERVGIADSATGSELERRFTHIWGLRGADLGDPDFRMVSEPDQPE